MLNGARNPPTYSGGSNLVLSFVSYLWNTTLIAISKMQTPFKDKPTTTTADKARADPPTLKKLWRDRRKGGVRQSSLADEKYILRRSATR
jgi:hypothetical protein